MNQIKKVVQDGYKCDTDHSDLELAYISLKIALKAYTSTYKELQYEFAPLINTPTVDYSKISAKNTYQILYTETIIHFQHFFELVLKSFLRNEHPLLSDRIQDDQATLLFKILKGQKVTPKEDTQLLSIEFGETINRVIKLGCEIEEIKELALSPVDFDTLRELNSLRNRIWHRGLFILNYNSLDILICKFVLPLLKKILSKKVFTENESKWKYSQLACSLKPLEELFEMSNSESIDIGKIAMLKEFCRAAYNNPLDMNNIEDDYNFKCDNYTIMERYAAFAKTNANDDFGDVTDCPVCGAFTLVHYKDCDFDLEDESEIICYTTRVACSCCDFTLIRGFKNPREYGLPNIDDFHLHE
ncbi:hypothetical protein [Aeromonas sp. R9-1]|uniref:hypothetical protein n=1 Tax=Aeromonas sp. R9-1 TaxID=3138478 RepID=UPI0034A54885